MDCPIIICLSPDEWDIILTLLMNNLEFNGAKDLLIRLKEMERKG